MPQHLSIASVIEANRLSSDIPFLCFLDVRIVDPNTGVVARELNLVRNNENVIMNGVEYEKAAFDITVTHEQGRQSDVKLIVQDQTQALQSLMEEYGGGVGSDVTFYIVSQSETGQTPELVEYFQVTSASAADYVQTFTLGAENALMQTFPRRRQYRDFCSWRYKSTECGYTGALPSCDLTLQGPNGCAVHGRSLSFGGFPSLNSNGLRYA